MLHQGDGLVSILKGFLFIIYFSRHTESKIVPNGQTCTQIKVSIKIRPSKSLQTPVVLALKGLGAECVFQHARLFKNSSPGCALRLAEPFRSALF